MKRTVIILMGIFALMACNNSKSGKSENDTSSIETEEITAIGGEKDEHGCLTAAGESWSELKQACIRVFDVAQRLNPVEIVQGEAVLSAFVLYNDDKSAVELFLPTLGNNHILEASSNGIYESGEYKFDSRDASLYINGIKTYHDQNIK